jgi:hypothetical protein
MLVGIIILLSLYRIPFSSEIQSLYVRKGVTSVGTLWLSGHPEYVNSLSIHSDLSLLVAHSISCSFSFVTLTMFTSEVSSNRSVILSSGDRHLGQIHTRPRVKKTKSAKIGNQLDQFYVNSSKYVKTIINGYFIYFCIHISIICIV